MLNKFVLNKKFSVNINLMKWSANIFHNQNTYLNSFSMSFYLIMPLDSFYTNHIFECY